MGMAGRRRTEFLRKFHTLCCLMPLVSFLKTSPCGDANDRPSSFRAKNSRGPNDAKTERLRIFSETGERMKENHPVGRQDDFTSQAKAGRPNGVMLLPTSLRQSDRICLIGRDGCHDSQLNRPSVTLQLKFSYVSVRLTFYRNFDLASGHSVLAVYDGRPASTGLSASVSVPTSCLAGKTVRRRRLGRGTALFHGR